MKAVEFECPSCGAPLNVAGADLPIITCPYCRTQVIVPMELRPVAPPTAPPVIYVQAPAWATRAAPLPARPVPRSSGCAGRVSGVFFVAALVIAAVVAFQWDSVQQAAQLVLPHGFAPLVRTFGAKGNGPGEIHNPQGLAVDGAGNSYVLDSQPGEVHKFDPQGHFLLSWGTGEQYPTGIAASRDGTVYVAQDGNIVKYSGATGAVITTLLPGIDFSMTRFQDMAVLPDGSLIVMLTFGDDLVHINAQGQIVQRWTNVLTGQTDAPEADPALAVSPTGDVYLLGKTSTAVYKLASDGHFLNRIGSQGDGPDQFEWPLYAITVDSQGRVYVSSSFKGILVFDPAGQYLGTIDPPERSTLAGMAVDAQDHLFALSGYNGHVYEYALPLPATPTPVVLIK